MRADIYIANNRLDLFKDENIEVNSSIADIESLSTNNTDYSRSFTVPASDNNNKIFKHYYDANIDNSFDARVKVNGRIEINGLPFKNGKWTLQKVSVKNFKASAYTINFVGNLIDIEKLVGKDKLSDLDLSDFDHDYNFNNVREGIRGALFGDDLVYTLIGKRRFYFNDDGVDVTNTPTTTNIASNLVVGAENGIRFNELAPSLRAIRILEAIEAKYSLTFSRDFFASDAFSKLKLWINNTENVTLGGGSQTINWNGGDSTNVNFVNDTGTFTAQNTAASNDRIVWDLYIDIIPESEFETVPYTLVRYEDDAETGRDEYTGEKTNKHTFRFDGGSKTTTFRYDIIAGQEFQYTAKWRQVRFFSGGATLYYTTLSSLNTITSDFIISKNIPELKVIDFLTGFLKAFKLVIVPENNGYFYVNTIDAYYSEGTVRDVTKYIDWETYDVERGTLLSEINYKFQEPTTLLNETFLENTELGYGDEETILKDNNGEPLDGKTQDIELPFEQIIYERLTDLSDGSLTNVSVGGAFDKDLNPVSPKAHFHYTEFVNQSSSIRLVDPADSINTFVLISYFPALSHSLDLNLDSQSFLFSSEFNYWNGNKLTQSLYNNYHKNYITGLFNPKRRVFYFEALLPVLMQLQLELNDTLKIKNNYYRIDNYELNLTTGKTSFKLFNSFDELIVSNPNAVYNLSFTSITSTKNIYYPYIGTESKIDTGDGVDWFSFNYLDGYYNITVAINNTGIDRSAVLEVVRDSDNFLSEIFITQNGSGSGTPITADNNTITADSTLITVDNG